MRAILLSFKDMEYKARLKKAVREHQSELDKDLNTKKKKKKDNRERTAFNKLPEVTKTEFFCDNCTVDIVAPTYKVWIDFYSIGIWKSNCPTCTLPVYRHITNKVNDPYYEKSKKIRESRSIFEADMMRPGTYGFKTLYGDPFAEYYMRYQNEEEQLRAKYLSMGLAGETIKERTEKDKMKEAFEGYV